MSKRFRIAFSFSGDKREFVAEIAGILARRFGKDHLLYDKYHEAEFARSNLAYRLPALYHDETDLVVAVLSNDYEKKEWCGLEWNAIYSLIRQGKADEVMLCRFDRVEGKGLFGLAGFIDLDDKTPAEVATLITERLALNEGYPKDYYTRDTPAGPDWPAVAPPLDWPVAGHSEAQQAPGNPLVSALDPQDKRSQQQISELTELLLACPSLKNRTTRETVINTLPPSILHAIDRSDQGRADIFNVVKTCLNYPGGLTTLVEAVRFFDRGTYPMQTLDNYLKLSNRD